MSEVDLSEVKHWLGSGGLSELAKDCGKTKNGITYIFSKNAKKPNVDVLKKAVERALKNQNEILVGIEKIKENARHIQAAS